MEASFRSQLSMWKDYFAMSTSLNTFEWRIVAMVGLASVVVWILYWAIESFYNLYLHPLSKFPGPRAACLSSRWVLKVSQAGHAEEVFEELHQKYNTKALRIAPNELHISDVNLYKTIYNQTSAFLKDHNFYGGFGTPHTVFVENDPALHRERRRLLNPFFSRGAIFKLERMLKQNVLELGNRIDNQPGPYNIYNAVRCMTVDIISRYYTGTPIGQLQISNENFYGGFLTAFDAVAKSLWNMVYLPHLRRILLNLPSAIAKRMSSDAASILSLADTCKSAAQVYKTNDDSYEHPVILSALSHLSSEAATAEAVDILVAGSDTTAFSLTVAIASIAKHADMKEKLVNALKSQISNAEELPSLIELEKIEYLNACVREAVRTASPVPGRLPRIVPESVPLIVDGKRVPPGSVVGMSAFTMHHSREIWGEDAASFNPERWLTREKDLDQYMVSFSKGLRSCIGQNLAYAEIHFLLAYIFRKYDVKLAAEKTMLDAKDAFTYCMQDHELLVNLVNLSQDAEIR